MRLVLVLLLLVGCSSAQALPDAPSTSKTKAGFFTFRKARAGEAFWDAPPLRTNREVLHSKMFLLLNGAYAASVITDVEYTHGRRESRGSEYPVIPVIIGLDYLMDRFISRSYSVEGPIYGIQHYVRDALKGR